MRLLPRFARLAIAALAAMAPHRPAHAGPAMDRIQAAGHFKCGAILEPLDWNKTDLHGNLSVMGVELCRAFSTVLLGKPNGFDVQSYTTEQDALTGLHKGKSDIILGVTPTAQYGLQFNARFSLPYFQDAQAIMVHQSDAIHSLPDLAGHKLCYIDATDNDAIALTQLHTHGINPLPFAFQEEGEMDAAIMDRHCQATTALLSKLAEARASFHNPQEYIFLPDLFTVVPVTAAVDLGDPRLAAIVDYTISALIEADALGITAAAAASYTHSDDPRLQRLMGEDYASALGLGLPHDWSRRLIISVGNYREIFARTAGVNSPLKLQPGQNAPWNKGGLLVPLPLD